MGDFQKYSLTSEKFVNTNGLNIKQYLVANTISVSKNLYFFKENTRHKVCNQLSLRKVYYFLAIHQHTISEFLRKYYVYAPSRSTLNYPASMCRVRYKSNDKISPKFAARKTIRQTWLIKKSNKREQEETTSLSLQYRI